MRKCPEASEWAVKYLREISPTYERSAPTSALAIGLPDASETKPATKVGVPSEMRFSVERPRVHDSHAGANPSLRASRMPAGCELSKVNAPSAPVVISEI